MQRIALNHDESNAFLGWIVRDDTSWIAQTIFGYTIARVETEADARAVLYSEGLNYLKGVWSYYDKQEGDWFACVIVDATEQRVTVIRTNDLGWQDPDTYKRILIDLPTETVLVKSS